MKLKLVLLLYVASSGFAHAEAITEQIAQLSKENSQLELAPMMLMVAQTYLNKQQKSLTKSGMSTNVFCAGKIK